MRPIFIRLPPPLQAADRTRSRRACAGRGASSRRESYKAAERLSTDIDTD
jgi:hypothetical protein